MAERLDVAGRLAEGQPAVEHTQTYVQACQLLGYHDPELTSRPNQIRECYGSEEGLDLRALDGDCERLRAAVGAVMEALRMQRAQVDELAAAWSGPGAESAIAFLQRHCDAANAEATEVRAAAQRCESLRDNLWHLVDVKVATATAIDDRTLANRPAWMAAAAAVTSGAGEPTAEKLVQKQIKPYVDNDIRTEWLTAMRSAQTGVATSYDMVIDKFAAAAPVYFEIPEDLRPGRAPFQPASAPAVTTSLAPAAAVPTLAPDPAPAAIPATPAAPTPASTSGTPGSPAPLTPPASDLGTGLDDASALPAGIGSAAGLDGLGGLGGLGGLASRILDEMSGLLGSAGEQLSDPSGLDDALDPDDHDDHDDLDDQADKHDKADDDESDGEPENPEKIQTAQAEEAKPGEAPPPAGGPPPIDAPLPAAAPPVDAPPPAAAPPPVAAVPSSGKTPCEIAADELPKAGQ
jgi:hypothetical protein